jgi:hypothetical protein
VKSKNYAKLQAGHRSLNYASKLLKQAQAALVEAQNHISEGQGGGNELAQALEPMRADLTILETNVKGLAADVAGSMTTLGLHQHTFADGAVIEIYEAMNGYYVRLYPSGPQGSHVDRGMGDGVDQFEGLGPGTPGFNQALADDFAATPETYREAYFGEIARN